MEQWRHFLEQKVKQYNRHDFIAQDPIAIPHQFSRLQDIEIAGLFAAVFAWGQRTTILNKSKELLRLMDNAPYQFITQHVDTDLQRFNNFRHRTFNPTDTLYFIHWLKRWYHHHTSLEEAFTQFHDPLDDHVGPALIGFHKLFFDLPEAPERTKKHIPTPLRKSTCKRLNMYLRWMVRQDDAGVDFGLWKTIRPHQLICPVDTHVNRIARELGLLHRKATDWLAALELTEALRELDPDDPVRYDFALFGLGIEDRKFGGLSFPAGERNP